MKSNKCSYKKINLKNRLIKRPCKYSYESNILAIKRHLLNSDIWKFGFGQNFSPDKIFRRPKFSSDKIFVTNVKFRHFCPTLFCPIRHYLVFFYITTHTCDNIIACFQLNSIIIVGLLKLYSEKLKREKLSRILRFSPFLRMFSVSREILCFFQFAKVY